MTIILFIIISFQPEFVYPSNKKDLDENESIKVKFIKICDCLSYLYYMRNRRKSKFAIRSWAKKIRQPHIRLPAIV